MMDIFKQIDVDNSQTIERDELINFLKKIEVNIENVTIISDLHTSTFKKMKTWAEINEDEEIKLEEGSLSAVEKVRKELGEFKFDEPEEKDKPVKKSLNKKISYEGETDDKGFKDGRGVQTWPDGTTYEGHWKNGKANGRGRLIHAEGDVQEVDWVDGKAEGKGFYRHADGSMYDGGWKDDKQHGYGSESFPDGSTYVGQYFDGEKHGQGKFVWKNGDVYVG